MVLLQLFRIGLFFGILTTRGTSETSGKCNDVIFLAGYHALYELFR